MAAAKPDVEGRGPVAPGPRPPFRREMHRPREAVMNSPWTLLGFALATAWVGYGSAQAESPPPRAKDAIPVEQLIRQLASADFPTREAAARDLLEREDAAAALEAALKAGDA